MMAPEKHDRKREFSAGAGGLLRGKDCPPPGEGVGAASPVAADSTVHPLPSNTATVVIDISHPY